MGKKFILRCKKCGDAYAKKYGGEKVSVEACDKCRNYFCPQHRWEHKYRKAVCAKPEDQQLDFGFPPAPASSAPQHGKG